MKHRQLNYPLYALVFSVVGGALGQLLMKAGMQGIHTTVLRDLHQNLFITPQASLLLGGGLFLYAATMPAWIIALKRYELSFAYPILSLGYLIVYIGASFWPGLEESITWQKTLGLMLIVAGVAIATQTNIPGGPLRYAKNDQA